MNTSHFLLAQYLQNKYFPSVLCSNAIGFTHRAVVTKKILLLASTNTALKNLQSKLGTGNTIHIHIWAGKFELTSESLYLRAKQCFTQELRYWFTLKKKLVCNNDLWEKYMQRSLETSSSLIPRSSVLLTGSFKKRVPNQKKKYHNLS